MKNRNENSSPGYQNKMRMLVVLLLFFAVTAGIVVRLGYIQLIKGNDYKKYAMNQWARDMAINAKRGTIYDSKGKKLAVSVNSNTVSCIPGDVKKGTVNISDIQNADSENFITKIIKKFDKNSADDEQKVAEQKVDDGKIQTAEEIATILAEILEMDYNEVLKTITSESSNVILKRLITDEQAQKIREQKLRGISVIDDNKRVYPYGAFAPYVLGFTNVDQIGMYGVEATFNEYLMGVPGREVINTDVHGREMPFGYSEYYEPIEGSGLVLTIDETIQHFAESAATDAYNKFTPLCVNIIVVDPKTGDVLAMASKPDYDPNSPRDPIDEKEKEEWKNLSDKELTQKWNDRWRNPIVNNSYEPGSTFKPLTVAAALEENKATVNSTYYCDGVVSNVKSYKPIKCWRYYNPHGQQTLAETIQNSCNDALAEIGRSIGADVFYKYIKAFGLTEKSGIALNGEAVGMVKRPANMTDVDLVVQSFGQGISITPIQLTMAIASLANGGNLMQPRIVKSLIDEEGNIIKNFDPVIRRKVVSEETSKIMMDILEKAVTKGTKQAYLPGYSIGGKTGTAQKVKDGKYSETDYVASYIGVAPTYDPQVVVLAIVDEPRGRTYFGSTVAAPVGTAVLENTLKYLNVEPKYTEEELGSLDNQKVIVPDVVGMVIGDASKKIESSKLTHNLIMDVEPEMTVKEQFPKAGEEVLKNSMITLILK